ncbi:adenylate/guanylate cyclase domain-containing protein [Floridanema evergladense]|uniref:Adenylate/guanylate cyclase domain-containing protein n=1 Tax=Floridaenema evergladense BLCC-F167 TaxID=3153639 RepID=A0ABV4WMD4_9CYAN
MQLSKIEQFFKENLILTSIDYLLVDDKFKVVEISAGVPKFSDCPPESILNQDVSEVLPELVGIEDIVGEILQGDRKYFDYKGIARLTASNDTLYINLHIIKDHEITSNQLLIILEDVTEKMLLEQTLVQRNNELELLFSKLSASNQYIDKIIGSMADALLVTTQSGKIKTVNKAAVNLFEYNEIDLINQHLSTIIINYENQLKIIQEEVLSTGESLSDIELICHTKTGKQINVSFSCSSIPTEIPGVQDYLYIGRDITEKQIIEQERKRIEKRLFAQYVISLALADSVNLKSTLPKILLGICESLSWDIGEFWLPEINDENPQLHCLEIWVKPHLKIPEFIAVTKQTVFPLGEGLPGKVWQTGAPLWMDDVVNDGSFVRSQIAANAGICSAFAFPIQHENETLGVMSFFSCQRQEYDEHLLQTMLTIGNQIGQFMQRERAELALHQEQQQTEQLLLNILPYKIAQRLKSHPSTIADYFSEVTVMFADIVGFTNLCSRVSATELVEILNEIFSEFDQLVEKHNLEKIKTIGDAYMVVAGLPKARADHAIEIAEMALDIQTTIAQYNEETNNSLNIRIGINSGDVVAGVIGKKKFTYDLWGDTVNIASRMESHGLPGKIQVTEATYQYLRDRYLFEQRGNITIKGKGEMLTYFLTGRI